MLGSNGCIADMTSADVLDRKYNLSKFGPCSGDRYATNNLRLVAFAFGECILGFNCLYYLYCQWQRKDPPPATFRAELVRLK